MTLKMDRHDYTRENPCLAWEGKVCGDATIHINNSIIIKVHLIIIIVMIIIVYVTIIIIKSFHIIPCRHYLSVTPSIPWIAITVAGFMDSPVAWNHTVRSIQLRVPLLLLRLLLLLPLRHYSHYDYYNYYDCYYYTHT